MEGTERMFVDGTLVTQFSDGTTEEIDCTVDIDSRRITHMGHHTEGTSDTDVTGKTIVDEYVRIPGRTYAVVPEGTNTSSIDDQYGNGFVTY